MMIMTGDTFGTSQEISRLLCAAVVSERFCDLVLADPVKAAKTGYQGEYFHFSDLELSCLSSIRAQSLADFAAQVMAGMEEMKLRLPILTKVAVAAG